MTWRQRWARWKLWLGFAPGSVMDLSGGMDPAVEEMVRKTPDYRPWHWTRDPDPVTGIDLGDRWWSAPLSEYQPWPSDWRVQRSCARPDDVYDWKRDGL